MKRIAKGGATTTKASTQCRPQLRQQVHGLKSTKQRIKMITSQRMNGAVVPPATVTATKAIANRRGDLNNHKSQILQKTTKAFTLILAMFIVTPAFPLPEPDSAARPTAPPEPSPPKAKAVESRGYGTRAESEPPRYVRRASALGYDWLSSQDWLLLGADYRVRYEDRRNDYRRNTLSDDPFLLRTRLFLGIF